MADVEGPQNWIPGDTDLRRSPRIRVQGVVTQAPVAGVVVDTSEAGLGLRTQEPLHVGERNVFHLQKGDVRLRYSGEVRWCHFESSVRMGDGYVLPVYRSGIALDFAGRREG